MAVKWCPQYKMQIEKTKLHNTTTTTHSLTAISQLSFMPNTFSVSIRTQSMTIHRIIWIHSTATHWHTVQWFSDHITASINVVCSCRTNVMMVCRLLMWKWRRCGVVVIIRFQCRRCGRRMLEIITFTNIRWPSLWIVGCSIRWLIWLTFRFVVVTAVHITCGEQKSNSISISRFQSNEEATQKKSWNSFTVTTVCAGYEMFVFDQFSGLVASIIFIFSRECVWPGKRHLKFIRTCRIPSLSSLMHKNHTWLSISDGILPLKSPSRTLSSRSSRFSSPLLSLCWSFPLYLDNDCSLPAHS